MENNEIAILFKALGEILDNQSEIKRHLGISKFDRQEGWSDSSDLSDKCWDIYNKYQYDND